MLFCWFCGRMTWIWTTKHLHTVRTAATVRGQLQNISAGIQIIHRKRFSQASAAVIRVVTVIAIAIIIRLPMDVIPRNITEIQRGIKIAVATCKGDILLHRVVEFKSDRLSRTDTASLLIKAINGIVRCRNIDWSRGRRSGNGSADECRGG